MSYIEREPLLAAYDAAHQGPPGGARKLIEEAPAVEVVPLDKLCELLKHCCAPCTLLYLRCPYDDYNCGDNKKCWYMVLKDWMRKEGLDSYT